MSKQMDRSHFKIERPQPSGSPSDNAVSLVFVLFSCLFPLSDKNRFSCLGKLKEINAKRNF